MKIKVLKDILGVNEQIAQNSHKLLEKNGVFCINIMASPGAGKTSLVVQTIKALKGKVKIGVIEGDISSSIDSETVAKEGIPVVQINTTGGECHLEAHEVQSALNNMPLKDIDLLLIENVGNLVCPAEFNLGEDIKVLVASVPEGDDKPFKYPLMFTTADALILNKIDLLPYVNFNVDKFTKTVKNINPEAEIFKVSCTTGDGITKWTKWLLARIGKKEKKRGKS
jgi:hydrogenase nickel incorporation protein HypB